MTTPFFQYSDVEIELEYSHLIVGRPITYRRNHVLYTTNSTSAHATCQDVYSLSAYPDWCAPVEASNRHGTVDTIPCKRKQYSAAHCPRVLQTASKRSRQHDYHRGHFYLRSSWRFCNVPGIWNEAQINAWREITDAVHENGSFIVCQLWALGRAANPQILAKSGNVMTSASDLPIDDQSATPRPLSEKDIQSFIDDYATAARNAVAAGFDAVEIHGANSYLCDQLL